MAGDDNYNGIQSELAYDLRQSWAKIVGGILERIVMCRMNRDYPSWFEYLRHLYIEADRKLSEEEREEYKKEYAKCVTVINNNIYTYSAKPVTQGTNNPNNTKQHGELTHALEQLELWIKRAMEEHKMYGDKSYDDEGL